MAIGAQPRHVVRQVIATALWTVAPGVAVGVAAAVASERLIESVLFGASAHDPVTYSSVAVFLLLTTAIAAYIPALRASRISAVDALRSE
jgi:ABC-type antimicrobial peptide transport system permease subunit